MVAEREKGKQNTESRMPSGLKPGDKAQFACLPGKAVGACGLGGLGARGMKGRIWEVSAPIVEGRWRADSPVHLWATLSAETTSPRLPCCCCSLGEG